MMRRTSSLLDLFSSSLERSFTFFGHSRVQVSESGPGPRVRTDVGSVSFRLKKYFFLNVDSRTTPKLLNKVENRGNNRENDTWEWLKAKSQNTPSPVSLSFRDAGSNLVPRVMRSSGKRNSKKQKISCRLLKTGMETSDAMCHPCAGTMLIFSV